MSVSLGTVYAILPAYNESWNIGDLLARFRAMEREGLVEACRLVVVDDGSEDDTGEIARNAVDGLDVHVIRHPKNLGLTAALLSGVEYVVGEGKEGDVVVFMDADDTHDPVILPEMVRRLDGGAGCVIASRYRPGSRQVGVPWLRRLLSRGANLLFWVLFRFPGIRDYTCGFRAVRWTVLQQVWAVHGRELITARGFACTDELLLHITPYIRRFEEIPFVLRYDRKRGKSKLQWGQTISNTLRILWRNRRMR